MKKIGLLLLFIVTLASCSKDKETNPPAKTVLMLKWNWVYGLNGANNGNEAYTFDADNKLSTSVFYNSETATVPRTYTYIRNTAGQIVKMQSATGYRAYEYNSSGQLTKSSLYDASGTLSSYYAFNYSDKGYERVSYSAAGVAGAKLVCTYTSDKMNIGKEIWYTRSGDVLRQTDYSYLTTKNPASIYPYSEVNMLDRGFVCKSAINVGTDSYPGVSNSITTTYSYTYNADGYPLTQKEIYSSDDAPSNTTFEYIEK